MKSVVYFLQRANGDIKIGTTMYYLERLHTLKQEHGELKLLGLMDGAREEEQRLHKQFAAHHRGGEWFESHADILQFVHDRTSLQLPLLLKVKPKVRKTYLRSRLGEYMERAGKTRMDLVRELRLSYPTVAKWETEKMTTTDSRILWKLLKYFNCSYMEFLYEVPEYEEDI